METSFSSRARGKYAKGMSEWPFNAIRAYTRGSSGSPEDRNRPMKIFLKAFAALILLVLAVWTIRSDSDGEKGSVSAAPRVARTPDPGADPSWRHAPLWDDGKAEFCAYDVTWARYGHHFAGRALLILVKEP